MKPARIAIAYLFALLFPLLAKYYFNSAVSVFLIAGLVWFKTSLCLLQIVNRGTLRRFFSTASGGYSLVLGLVLLVGILVTPYSAYQVWFRAVVTHTARGLISTLFVLLVCLFSSSFSGLLLRGGFAGYAGALLGMFSVASGLSAVISPNSITIGIVLLSLALGLIYFARRFGNHGTRLRVFILSFSVALLLAPLSFLFHRLGDAVGSRFVDDTVHPGLRQTVIAVFPEFPLLYGMAGYGHSFDEKRLGATPVLSDAPVMDVEGPPGSTLYLRTRTYDFYDGTSWKSTRLSQTERLSQTPRRFRSGEATTRGEDDLRITIRLDYYNLLPHTLDTGLIMFEEQIPELDYGDEVFGYVLRTPLVYGASYILARNPAVGDALPDTNPYLQVPAGVSEATRETAARFAADNDTLATLQRIEAYLASQFTYDLQADPAATGVDFIDYFLFEAQRGFCVHFASSFIVLARLNGIHARYATGFLAKIPPNSTTTTVSGFASHAWPEVWLEDQGWVAWEATTALNSLYYQEFGDELFYDYDVARNTLTSRQLANIMGRRPADDEVETDRRVELPLATIGLSLLAAVAALALVYVGASKMRVFALFLLRKDHRTAMRVLERIVALQRKKGISEPRETGWIAWSDAITKRKPELKRTAARLAVIVVRMAYGRRRFRRMDLFYIMGFYRRYC